MTTLARDILPVDLPLRQSRAGRTPGWPIFPGRRYRRADDALGGGVVAGAVDQFRRRQACCRGSRRLRTPASRDRRLRWHGRWAAMFLEARYAPDHHGANDQQRPGCGLWDRRQSCQGQGGAARTVVGCRLKVESQGILAVPDERRKEIRPYLCEGVRTGGGSDSRAPTDDAVAESDGGKPVQVVEYRKENRLGIACLRAAVACNIERIGEAGRRDRAQ